MNGKIVYVRKNYGLISTKLKGVDVRLFFIVIPEYIIDGKFGLGNYVTFETRNILVRGMNVVEAYNLKPFNSKPKTIKLVDKISFCSINAYGYTNIYSNCPLFDETINNKLVEKEKSCNSFLLKWILFLENQTKQFVDHILLKQNISSIAFINALLLDKKTNKIISDALRKIKDFCIFRTESDVLTFERNPSDPNDVCIKDAPIIMVLEQLTLNDLSSILNFVQINYFSNIAEDDKILLNYLTGMLSDVSFIRNKIAHGQIFIPLVLDPLFSPTYFYEMANAFPSWNSNEFYNNIEKYPAFTFIRFLTKSMAKEGINLSGINSSPQMVALFFTKSLLINEARKSLFSLMFLLMCIFTYWNNESFADFFEEFKKSGLFGFKESPTSIFSTFPDQNTNVEAQITRLLMPIFYYCHSPSSFKMYSSVCKF